MHYGLRPRSQCTALRRASMERALESRSAGFEGSRVTEDPKNESCRRARLWTGTGHGEPRMDAHGWKRLTQKLRAATFRAGASRGAPRARHPDLAAACRVHHVCSRVTAFTPPRPRRRVGMPVSPITGQNMGHLLPMSAAKPKGARNAAKPTKYARTVARTLMQLRATIARQVPE